MEFNKDTCLSVADVLEKYQSFNEMFNKYNDMVIHEETPYIDDVVEIYKTKKEQVLARRQRLRDEQLQNAIKQLSIVANPSDMRKGAMVDRLRNKLTQRKNKHVV
jgi:polyhydroxyalkanoate synthesis regulator phasin